MSFYITNNEATAVALIKRLNIAFGYPNGNATTYAEVMKPFDTTDTRVAVFLEDRCLAELTTTEKAAIVPSLPATFQMPLPTI